MKVSLCAKCIASGVISGSGMIPADNFQARFTIIPNTGEHLTDFERSGVVFTATELTKDGQGGYSATGTLKGPFGVFPDRDADEIAEATLEAYARDGEVAFIHLEVPDGSGGIRFQATFTPTPDPGAFEGRAFMTRLGEANLLNR